MADWYLKKSDIDSDIMFDLVVQNNDIKTDDSIVTATIISIFTDASLPQIGEQIDGKVLGNKNYTLDKLSTEGIKAYEEGILESIQWLIEDGVLSGTTISTEKQGNALLINLTLTVDAENEINLIYSLDEKLEILD